MAICDRCWGNGYIVTCCDDMCVGMDHCIHGDGEEICSECGGSGEVFDGYYDGFDPVPSDDEVIERCEDQRFFSGLNRPSGE